MILGVGDGTFAVVLTAVVSILLSMVVGYFWPRTVLFSSLLILSLPFIVFGIITSAPRAPSSSSSTGTQVVSLYHDVAAPTDDVLDVMLPVRIVVLTLQCVALVGAFAVYVYDALNAPLFVAPAVQCRRKQLEALHPSWYK